MRYSEAGQGRSFVLRLEHGEILHETIEAFARDKGVRAAYLVMVGAADKGSRFVVGPEEADASPVVPMETTLTDVHEIAAVGTLFPNAEGDPILHAHAACGRGTTSLTGCVRRGVKVWHVLEVVMRELTDCSARRLNDPATGFELLVP